MSAPTADEVFDLGREFGAAVLARPGDLDRDALTARLATIVGHVADGRLDLARHVTHTIAVPNENGEPT
ncbi:hypothetical protein [Gordonia sp. NB41Y]|uniref:hypothetical protein n=1 Tax=Gordonia sp. NB41Y TaxID=875808 RepID=UPI0002BEC41E|nr:hypothetical protein [Gordonia sp. NB41Y]EMP12942.1 hypothetical protein ISGA_2529 [Gordonia sp. NB41Y]WLP90512.1 hypothetical protein Q9K23_23940 [Gordonia sp. NB41Y]